VIEVDTALSIAHDLHYKTKEDLQALGNYIISTFKQLSKLIAAA
jgi:hypothetical protein